MIPTQFLGKLETTLHKMYLCKKKCIIMGDISIDIIKNNNISKEYLNLIQSEGFSQLIFEATHITELSQSCINHILTNYSTSCQDGSLAIEIADHLPVFTILYDPNFSPLFDVIEFSQRFLSFRL